MPFLFERIFGKLPETGEMAKKDNRNDNRREPDKREISDAPVLKL